MKWKMMLAVLMTISSLTSVQAQVGRNVSEYNLENGIGLKGYDPVSYFVEGGGVPKKGLSEFTHTHLGVTYMFSSEENKEQFKWAPEKYEPTYGGFCAYGMAFGQKIEIQPTIYTINGNRIHFFVSNRVKRNFDSDLASFEMRADDNWKNISGEEPRF